MKIEVATKQDIEEIVELWKALSDTHRSFTDYMAPAYNWYHHIKNLFYADFEDPLKLILIARNYGETAGFIRAEIKNTTNLFEKMQTGYISELYVKPAFRGTGLASELLEWATGWLKHQRIYHVRLNVNSDNDRALRFYEKVGFQEVNKTLKLNLYD